MRGLSDLYFEKQEIPNDLRADLMSTDYISEDSTTVQKYLLYLGKTSKVKICSMSKSKQPWIRCLA